VKIFHAVLVCCIAVSAYAQDPASFAANLRAGESINGFPNWSERVVLEWMNRARVDPQTEMTTCGTACGDAACYVPVMPLVWSESLNHAARFHSDEMTKQGYFDHNSHCAIASNIDTTYPVACDASASCACTSSGTTLWNSRVALFGIGATGEIIAGTPDPNRAFYLWLYEQATVTGCGFTTVNGHRWLILTSMGSVGVGVSGNDAVGDFSAGDPPYKIPSAAHYPKQAATVALWANWYDTAAPKSANAVVDGKCTTMSLQRGTPKNGAWSANANGVGSGCHRYYFSLIDSANNEYTYPVTGSLGIGDASCDDWNSTRTTAKCSTSTTPPPPPATPSPSKRRAVKHR